MSSDALAASAYARQVFVEQCSTEAAGLFWIGAELAILVGVIAARRDMAARLGMAVHQNGILRLAVFTGFGFVLLALVTQARYMWWVPVHLRIDSGELTETLTLQAAYRAQNHTHYALWAGFTLGWIVLEAAIVYQGWHVCRGLRALLTRDPLASCVVCLLLLAVPAHAQEASLLAALHSQDFADVLYRNALGLWLRVAGVAWIAVEWVAAVLLWRTYRLLRSTAPGQVNP
jgi:hypothetical protein